MAQEDNYKIVNFDPEVLREYDIRGVVGENINENNAYTIGRTFGYTVKTKLSSHTIVTGYDGRLTSPFLHKALCVGLKDAGINENSTNYDETLITSISRIDNVELSGYKVSNRKIVNLGTKYRAYIKVIYPIGSANKILVDKINKEEELKLRLESSEAFKELEDEIENAENN